MKANILLLRPKGRKTDSRLFATEQLGLSYIAAIARTEGLSVEILDGFLEPVRYERLLSELTTDDYQVIGYPIYPETLQRVARDADRIRNRGVKAHITIGNHLPTACADKILKEFPQFDSAIRGEGEYTLTELAQTLANGKNLSTVAGLTYRECQDIFNNPPRPNTADLDQLPFPARDTLPLVIEAGNAPLLYSSRGCNARCTFCSVHNFFGASPNSGWRGRSPTNVVDEMERLAEDYGVKDFAFADEQFMGHGQVGVERALGIAEELIRRGLKFNWYIETRSADVKFEVFKKLQAAGLRAVFMGMESGYDPTLLKYFRKGIRVSQHCAAMNVLKQLEILPSVGFIMFQPETTLEELEYNLSFLEQIGGAEVTALVTKLRVYAGTATEAVLFKQDRLRGKYYEYDWDFEDQRVKACYDVIFESADTLSISYNEFARMRRTGLLSYDECLKLQQAMNTSPISIMRSIVREIALQGPSEDLAYRAREQFKNACEAFLRLVRFIELIARKRQLEAPGVRLLTPMYLC